MVHKIVSFYREDLNPEVIKSQKKVFDFLGIELEQVGFSDLHSDAINRYLSENNEYDLITLFDVDCIVISCGAISSLIANRVNKDYLLIGSDSLTFFGIKHGRLNKTYDETWIDVPESYKPPNYKMIENGCYW